MTYQYSYFISNLPLLVIWLILFWWRKDVRREMLIMSVIFGLGGPLVQWLYTIDWWRPLTITGTRLGIEDFLFGFWVGGVSAVIYLEIFKKKNYPVKRIRGVHLFKIFLLNLFLSLIFFGSFFIFKISSFYSSIAAFIPLILFIWFKRPDLIKDSIFSGILLILVGWLWFWVPELITPSWVQHHWLFKNLSGIIIFRMPLEDGIWGFLAGAYIGPLFEFIENEKLVKNKKS